MAMAPFDGIGILIYDSKTDLIPSLGILKVLTPFLLHQLLMLVNGQTESNNISEGHRSFIQK